MFDKYIVTNFAYGTGPYVMTTKLAIVFNDEMEKAGQPRMGIIVPWVYGEKQKKIMAEEFSDHDKKYPGEIILDAGLGAILEKVFYANEDYATYLERWTANFKEASREANSYLLKKYGAAIAVELNRSPRLLYNVAPAYSTSFGYLSQIFDAAAGVSEIKIPAVTLKKAAEISRCIEREQVINAVAYPGVFSYEDTYQPVYKKSEVIVPPIGPITEEDFKKHQHDPIPNSHNAAVVFVTKTGIPGLERIYNEITRLGLYPYSNSDGYSPNLVSSSVVQFHFARSGWASIWRSLISEKPMVVPAYDPKDDPEIYFNNKAVENLGVGVIYKGGGINEMMSAYKKMDKIKIECQKLKNKIRERFNGELDGTRYCAGLFAREFLKTTKPL